MIQEVTIIKIKTSLLMVTVSLLLLSSLDAQDFKWYPGHYILLPMMSDRSMLESRIEELADIPVVRGYQRRYFWIDLEPERDTYNFSQIIEDLNYVQSKGKLLVVQIQFKTPYNNRVFILPIYSHPNLMEEFIMLRGDGITSDYGTKMY
jgi:hypothetical protein